MRHAIDRRLENYSDRLARAARLKPPLDGHLAEQLAYCDTKGHNETGISGNTISDPVIASIMSRAAIIDRSNLIERRMTELEACINALDEAMRAAWGQARPAQVPEAPVCYVAGCSREVGSYRRADGSIAFRMGGDYGGMCDTHYLEATRAAESNARRQRRYKEAG